ncbi:MAG: prephenate dehydrogenase [Acidobacteriota bacterium]|nr:prephenate dehydrogenase [Acidobacteriota bacterium]
MTKPRWERVTVVGCGLVGASFALALKRAGACGRVAGWDVDASALEESLRLGAIDEVDAAFDGGKVSSPDDEVSSLDDMVSSSDLIYLAMPVGQIIAFLRDAAPHVKPGAVITDAGSTKAEVCRAARACVSKRRRFVGGHPVAGSHLRGAAHARADLFDGAPYVLTTVEDGSDAASLDALEETLRHMGARVRVTTAAEHDRALALVSHLPQVVSGALAAVVAARPDSDALKSLSGAGYRDMTRLAASPWGVWHDILATNPAEIADALDALISKLAVARDELRDYSQTPEQARARLELSLTSALFDQHQTN